MTHHVHMRIMCASCVHASGSLHDAAHTTCRFWKCPNGSDCKYRHALPPGYVLKSQMKELLEAEVCQGFLRAAVRHCVRHFVVCVVEGEDAHSHHAALPGVHICISVVRMVIKCSTLFQGQLAVPPHIFHAAATAAQAP